MPEPVPISAQNVTLFQNYIHAWFKAHGRTDYPWRQTTDPYQIMVSEVMLQQTQTDRVIPKFISFIKKFPDIEVLAQAPTAEVITAWSGLGYNRRGLNLQRAAQLVVSEFGSEIPSKTDQLLKLPGIGPYATAAIQAFAFHQPSIVIETNIRAVFMYHFWPQPQEQRLDHKTICDQQLAPLIEQTLDRSDPHTWYSALMDYGAQLKKLLPNPSRRSKHYAKQSTFKGSFRQIRGQIIKHLTQLPDLSIQDIARIAQNLQTKPERVNLAVESLLSEGFLEKKSDASYQLKR